MILILVNRNNGKNFVGTSKWKEVVANPIISIHSHSKDAQQCSALTELNWTGWIEKRGQSNIHAKHFKPIFGCAHNSTQNFQLSAKLFNSSIIHPLCMWCFWLVRSSRSSTAHILMNGCDWNHKKTHTHTTKNPVDFSWDRKTRKQNEKEKEAKNAQTQDENQNSNRFKPIKMWSDNVEYMHRKGNVLITRTVDRRLTQRTKPNQTEPKRTAFCWYSAKF